MYWPFVLLGLGLLGLGLSFWRPIPGGVWHDDGVYLIIGESVANGGGLHYSGVPGNPPAVKFPPGYPMLLAGLWALFGNVGPVTLVAELLNLGLLAGAGMLLAWGLHAGAGLRRRDAVLLAGLAFISADVWRPALVPLSESFFIALSMGSLALWGRASEEGDRRWAAGLALVLVALVLTRSAGLAVVAGFAVALVARRGWATAVAVTAAPVGAALGWATWAAANAAAVPEGLRDVLGPYGTWLSAQFTSAPGRFLAELPTQGMAVSQRVFSLLIPGLEGRLLWVAAVPMALAGIVGMLRLFRKMPPVPWILLAYVGMLTLWPFTDRRLVAPLHPFAVVCVAWGAFAFLRSLRTPWAKRAAGALVFAWIAAYVSVTASRAARGWGVAGYQLRSGRLASAVEVLKQTAPADAVVGAPEFWAALHLHGGWSTVPSARFAPRAEGDGTPLWGSPEEQLNLWRTMGVDHVLLEQGGQIHGDALNLLERRCPGAVGILARMPPQILVRLDWDAPCTAGEG